MKKQYLYRVCSYDGTMLTPMYGEVFDHPAKAHDSASAKQKIADLIGANINYIVNVEVL